MTPPKQCILAKDFVAQSNLMKKKLMFLKDKIKNMT
jgi:hypothetical protein